ncbi:22914_t:CDS:2, partial [Gigaspora rosea]
FPEQITHIDIQVLIVTTKALMEVARELRKIYFFRQIPSEWIKIPKTILNLHETMNGYYSDHRSVENILPFRRFTLLYAPTPRFTEELIVQQTNNDKISQPFPFQDTHISNLTNIGMTIDENVLVMDNNQSSGIENQNLLNEILQNH